MKPLSEVGGTPTPSKSSSGRPSSTPIGVTDDNVSVPVVVEKPGVSEGPEDFSRILVAGATGGVGKCAPCNTVSPKRDDTAHEAQGMNYTQTR